MAWESKKTYKNMSEYYWERFNQAMDLNDKLMKTFKQHEAVVQRLNTELSDGNLVLGMQKIEGGLRLAVGNAMPGITGLDVTIKAYNLLSGTSSEAGKLFIDYLPRDTTFRLVDVLPNEHNKGIGTLMIEAAKTLGKWLDVKKIVGFLSSVDLSDPDHAARLQAFYIKNEFEIIDIPDSIEKRIRYLFPRRRDDSKLAVVPSDDLIELRMAIDYAKRCIDSGEMPKLDQLEKKLSEMEKYWNQ